MEMGFQKKKYSVIIKLQLYQVHSSTRSQNIRVLVMLYHMVELDQCFELELYHVVELASRSQYILALHFLSTRHYHMVELNIIIEVKLYQVVEQDENKFIPSLPHARAKICHKIM